MEQSKGFNLDRAIEEYLRSIPEEHCAPADLTEWMDHFQEETRNLIKVGLSAEEAFMICRLRFGERDLIIAEYEKTDRFSQNIPMTLKAVFFTVSFSMILSLNSYFSFFSSTFLSQYIPTDSPVLMWTDLLLKVVFIGFSLLILFRALFRKNSFNSDTYGILSILYILVLIVLYFFRGFYVLMKPEIRSILFENTVWVNTGALFALILYSIYLTSKEVDYKLDVVS